jgi:hypothetical protein
MLRFVGELGVLVGRDFDFGRDSVVSVALYLRTGAVSVVTEPTTRGIRAVFVVDESSVAVDATDGGRRGVNEGLRTLL